jgi:hypothetical protein
MILDEIQKPYSKEIEKLREDEFYYGDFGRQYLSNSDIGSLLNNPKDFRSGINKPTIAMLLGRYFHTDLLEPQKLSDFDIIDASTRTTKAYKELGKQALLTKEVEMLSNMAKAVRMNLDFYDMMYKAGNQFEVPAIKEVGGQLWKGKADIVSSDAIIDLKTTTKIDDFKYSARRYNYDSQAWLYGQFFNRPMVFIVVEKNTYKTGLFECSETFLEYGKQKVFKAIEVYENFFVQGAPEDINQYYHVEQL